MSERDDSEFLADTKHNADVAEKRVAQGKTLPKDEKLVAGGTTNQEAAKQTPDVVVNVNTGDKD